MKLPPLMKMTLAARKQTKTFQHAHLKHILRLLSQSVKRHVLFLHQHGRRILHPILDEVLDFVGYYDDVGVNGLVPCKGNVVHAHAGDSCILHLGWD